MSFISRKYRMLKVDLMRKDHDHKESRHNQRREHDKKVQLLSKQVEDREKRIHELEEKNKLLTKFYRDNKDRRTGCGESAAAAAEGSRSRRSAREREQYRNPDLIELAPTDSPSAASSSAVAAAAGAASRRGKPSVTIRDQKLIIEDHKKKPTSRVSGVQRPSM